jgi:hypothetical protein
MIYLMPESPRYHMKHGRYEEALDAFNQIQTTPLLAARDLMYAHAQLDFESRMLKGKEKEFDILANRIETRTLNVADASHGGARRSEDRDHGNESFLELDDLGQLPSDVLSLDIDLDIEMAREQRNPYSYHIGVTIVVGHALSSRSSRSIGGNDQPANDWCEHHCFSRNHRL